MANDEEDVPLRTDHRDPATARAWLEDTRLRRPSRQNFRAAFCAALAPHRQLRILELGSGPGELARELPPTPLSTGRGPCMTSRSNLGHLASRVSFVVRDFREPAWVADLGTFDAIVTQQAVHETRHKRHALPLFQRARTLLAPGGAMLYCDGYLVDPAAPLAALTLERADQPRVLERAGFVDVRRLHDEGSMALYHATNPR